MRESVDRRELLGVLPHSVWVQKSTGGNELVFSAKMETGKQFIEGVMGALADNTEVQGSFQAGLQDLLAARLQLFDRILMHDIESVLSSEIRSEVGEETEAEVDEEYELFPRLDEETEEPREIDEEQEQEEQEEGETTQPAQFYNLVDYLHSRNSIDLRESVRRYYDCFIRLHSELLEILPQLMSKENVNRTALLSCISDILGLETIPIQPGPGLVRTVGRGGRARQNVEILVMLDTHPVRLILLDKKNETLLEGDKSSFRRAFIPPILVRLPRKNEEEIHEWSRVFTLGRPLVYHAYRTISQHAAYLVGFCKDEKVNSLLQEDGLATITNSIWLHDRSKRASHSASRDTRPRFVSSVLVEILLQYMRLQPHSRDQLRVLDIGSRTGALAYDVLRKTWTAASERDLIDELSHAKVVLNDIDEEQLGRNFVQRRNMEEVMYRYCEISLAPYPAYDLLLRLVAKAFSMGSLTKPSFDVCFLNRVVDMYGTYTIDTIDTISERTEREKATYEVNESSRDFSLAGRNILLYDGFADLNSWHSVMAFLLDAERWLSEKSTALRYPAVRFDLATHLFDNRFPDPFRKLADLSEIVVLSAFPGSSRSIVGFEGEKDGMFAFQLGEASTESGYRVVCLSKNRALCLDLEKNLRHA
jgi:SAM-dependent methyltransferase